MARINRRGRYYNYPNLRTNMNQPRAAAAPPEASSQELHAMNEIPVRDNAEAAQQMRDTPSVRSDAPVIPGTDDSSAGSGASGNQEVSRRGTENGNNNETCNIRFFNAAAGYGGLEIMVAGKMVSRNLPFGEESDYDEVPDGFQQVMITMVQEPKAVLLNKRLPFRNCMDTTAAIMNTSTGIEVMMINDTGCNLKEENRACFRVVNLSYTSPALDVVLENGNPVFEDIRFKQVTEYKQAVPGEYNMNVMLARTAQTVKTNTVDVIMPERPQDEGGYPGEDEKAYAYFFEDFEDGERYTAYIIGNKDYDPPLRVETLEEGD